MGCETHFNHRNEQESESSDKEYNWTNFFFC